MTTGSNALAEELVQDAFADLYRRFEAVHDPDAACLEACHGCLAGAHTGCEIALTESCGFAGIANLLADIKMDDASNRPPGQIPTRCP